MDDSFIRTTEAALEYFGVSELEGLSDVQTRVAKERHGPNCEHTPHS